jgi:NAD(P)-dependent dehydrogenase (short-subunit alcohol dehydrogenase family)
MLRPMTNPPSPFVRPDWSPAVAPGSRILVVGASGGIGRAVVEMLRAGSDCVIGAHGNTARYPGEDDAGLHHLQAKLQCEADCADLVGDFCDRAGGIDGLVVLAGSVTPTEHWDSLSEEAWTHDLYVNLNLPFFLARAAMRRMKQQGGGGRIVLNGTESALHGGSPHSFPYAVAKRGTECLVEGLARDGAPNGILVNGVRLGFIASGFHQRWAGRDEAFMAERAELVPLKRGGDPAEAAALIVYLLSGWASFITGQMIPLTGGDWL